MSWQDQYSSETLVSAQENNFLVKKKTTLPSIFFIKHKNSFTKIKKKKNFYKN